MNFTAVLKDIREMQTEEADRIAEVAEQRAELQGVMRRALNRLMNAELDIDMRYWTQSERDELRSAEAAFDQAMLDLNLFNASNK